ncbi:MAG TPA: hypothetical protein VLM75_05895 [Spirochaetota bacterium]|nr:hypothetical protein [Spirochaetota bacterium]
MRSKIIGRSLLLTAALIIFPAACTSADGDNEKGIKNLSDQKNRAPGEYLIKLGRGAGKEEIEKRYGRYGIVEMLSVGDRLYKLKIKEDPGPEMIREIAENGGAIEYAEPNYIYKTGPPGKRGKLKLGD